jgi:hypothetical protein
VQIKQIFKIINNGLLWLFGSNEKVLKPINGEIQTYIRPFRYTLFLYLKGVVIALATIFLVTKIMIKPMMLQDPVETFNIIGRQTYSTMLFFAMGMISPIFGFMFMFPNFFTKYELEINAGLIPTHNGNVLHTPEKIDNQEPVWINNYEFETTVKLVDTENAVIETRIGSMFEVQDLMLPDNYYLLSDKDLSKYFNCFVNGKLMGKFTFRKYSSRYRNRVYLEILEILPFV